MNICVLTGRSTPRCSHPRLEFAGLNEHAEGNPSFGMLSASKSFPSHPLRRPKALIRNALWLRDSFIRSRSLNAHRIVAGSFAAIILIGGAAADPAHRLQDGQSAGFFTGLFTATSSTCVTGLILVDTWTQWTLFGQAVILTMIQLGGLGFMTVITLVSFALHRRIGLSERLIMVSTPQPQRLWTGWCGWCATPSSAPSPWRRRGGGAMSLCLIPEFGFLKGSAAGDVPRGLRFCNAGFDLLGGRFGAFSSLAGYNDTP